MITITELNLKKCKTSKSACERERERSRFVKIRNIKKKEQIFYMDVLKQSTKR